MTRLMQRRASWLLGKPVPETPEARRHANVRSRYKQGRTGIPTLLLVATSFLTACTFSAITPTGMGTARPATSPRTLMIGDLQMADPLWEPYRLHYTRGVEDWLKRNGGLQIVPASGPPPPQTIVLVTRITEFDKGSTALRWIVGMGAGQAKIRGDIELRDPAGTVLARFTSRESYLGGWGIGGAGFLDMEDLMRRFAETVAQTSVKWARGEPTE